MQLLKLLLVFVLLFEAISAAARDNENKNSFSVEKTWQSYKKKDDSCKCTSKVDDETWKEAVQECYDGIRNVAGMFSGNAYAYELADTVMISLEQYLTKLMYFSNTNTTVLKSSSDVILGMVAKCNKLNLSANNILIEYGKVLPEIVQDFKAVATKLSDHIGHVTSSFNKAVDELGSVLSKFIKEFLLSSRSSKSKVDYQPTLKKLQKLMNMVALIAETALKESEVKQEVQEAVTVLSLIFWCFAIVVQGINSCHTHVLFDNKCAISQTTASVSTSFDYIVGSVTQAGSAIVLPFDKSITDFLTIFVNITMALNAAVKDILGLFDGVAITVGDITRNLFKSQSLTSVTNGRTNILKG